MKRRDRACLFSVATLVLAGASQPSAALEPGQALQTKPGIAIGVTAIPLPPALYLVNHNFYYDYRLTGAGVATVPNAPRGHAEVVDLGLLWVPGWTVLGATYSAYVAIQYVRQSINSAPSAGFPGVSYQGVHNAFIGPLRLQWSLGHGFYAQAGVGVYVPTGTISGPLGNSNTGADYFTFQPNLAFTYLTGTWSFTAYSYYEHNTEEREVRLPDRRHPACRSHGHGSVRQLDARTGRLLCEAGDIRSIERHHGRGFDCRPLRVGDYRVQRRKVRIIRSRRPRQLQFWQALSNGHRDK